MGNAMETVGVGTQGVWARASRLGIRVTLNSTVVSLFFSVIPVYRPPVEFVYKPIEAYKPGKSFQLSVWGFDKIKAQRS